MVKDSWGKKHVCPFCGVVFYDMKKEVIECPKCHKGLSVVDEIEFIKKKKKAESLVKDSQIDDLNVVDEDIDISDPDFFDVDNDAQSDIVRDNYDDDEDNYN